MIYRHRITLQSNSPTAIAGGCYTASWATVTTFWGNVMDAGAVESTLHSKAQQITAVKILARYTTGIDKKTCRLVYGSDIIVIESVIDVTNRKNEIVIQGRYEKR